MIHDSTVEVTCDNDAGACWENLYIPIPAGLRNTYIAEDSQIEKEIQNQGWIVKGDKHFCSEKCAETMKESEGQ